MEKMTWLISTDEGPQVWLSNCRKAMDVNIAQCKQPQEFIEKIDKAMMDDAFDAYKTYRDEDRLFVTDRPSFYDQGAHMMAITQKISDGSHLIKFIGSLLNNFDRVYLYNLAAVHIVDDRFGYFFRYGRIKNT